MKKRSDSILIGCTNLILPILTTLGLYIVIHGHLSPGGGFQGGVLLGGAFVVIFIGYGNKKINKDKNSKIFKILEDIGALGFIILAFIGLLSGKEFFTNTFNKGTLGEVFSSGSIFLMNFSVGFKVFAGIAFLIMILLINLKKGAED